MTEPSIEDQDHINQDSKVKNFKDPLYNFDSKNSDLNLADSFLDFDSIKELFEDYSPNLDRIGLEKIEFGVLEKSLKMSEQEKSHFGNLVSDGSDSAVKAEEASEGGKEKNLSCCIEEDLGKVSLDRLVGVKSGIVSDEKESESDSESESESSASSSSTSSSSSDDDDEEEDEDEELKKEEVKEVKRGLGGAGELEEGEIEDVDREEMTCGIDDDEEDEEDEVEMIAGIDVDIDDGDEIGGGATEGPIRSKNELQVLPPVPQVNVVLQPHHQMLPVGVVLSVLGVQVIVEGVEKHNPLNEGSILWITESRVALGLIDEIFGPVKAPYYVVRYNSESEIPAKIHVGTSISFVQDFANHVLNDKNLYEKGYDASGENDEELSDEAEFSDDEKEAEFKRRQKMGKRGMNDQKPGNRKNNRKKVKNKDGIWRNGRPSVPQMDGVGQLPPNQNQCPVSHVPASLDHGNCSTSSMGQGFVGGTGLAPQLQHMVQNTGFSTSPTAVWTDGTPPQQPQSTFFPNLFPTNCLSWPSQNYQQHPYQPMMNSGLFLQQSSQMSLPNVGLPGGPSNFFAGPTYAPWQGLVRQNGLNQTIGQGLPQQLARPSINAGQGIVPPNGLHVEQNNLQQAAVLRGSIEAPQQFNMGASSSRGRKPYQRGGGRFAGGRVRHRSQ